MSFTFKNYTIGSIVFDENGNDVAILAKQEPAYGEVPEGMFYIEYTEELDVNDRVEISTQALQGAVLGCKVLFNKKENERMCTAQ